MITCNTLSGHLHRVAASELIFRPSVYALIPSDGRIVLVTMQSTGHYGLPGGAVELGARREAALIREVREETGLQVTVGRLLHVEETFFYYEPTRQAFHQFSFFYLCHPPTHTLCADDQVDDDVSQMRQGAPDVSAGEERPSQTHAEVIAGGVN